MLNPANETDLSCAGQTSRPMQILVLDDSELDRQRILRLCDDAGLSFVAREVTTLGELRDALDDQSFDLVFIDYLLAGEDGLDAIDLVASEHRSSASIMIAGEGRIDIAVEAMRRGCSDYLTKSDMTVEGLQKSIASALERQMMALTLETEREERRALERSIRQYANAASAEMRTILAGTLRRVRKLRSHKLGEDYASDIGALEACIDRMWEALPDFDAEKPLAISPTHLIAPPQKH
ncbi:MAG: response regulator [Paracoccaceae bacterium]|nr:response regulator [Paracoccaceae bacterium]